MDNIIYLFSATTFEYICQALGEVSPLEPEVILVPACGTRRQPPATGEREVAVYLPEQDDWVVKPDWRGVALYSTTDGSAVSIADIGQTPADVGATEQAMPSPAHVWDGAGWVLDQAMLAKLKDQARASVWAEIRATRDRLQLQGGISVGGRWFLSTERATGEYNSLINAAHGLPDNTVLRAGWRTMDGSQVAMTPGLARQILLAGIAQRCAIDDAAQAHKVALDACENPADYDYSGGWPLVFGGA